MQAKQEVGFRGKPTDTTSVTAQAGSALGDLLPPWLWEIVHEEGRLTLTDGEAARLVGISRGSVRQAIAAGDIEVLRLGRRLLIPLLPLLSKMMGVEGVPDMTRDIEGGGHDRPHERHG